MSNNIAGVLFPTDNLSLQQVVSFAKQIEEMDYQSLWIPEFFGRDQVALSALLLGETSKIKVATGISNIYTKDAMAMAQASHTLNEIFPSRFNLGLGVSHSIGAKMRGHEWENPIRKMKKYLLDLFLARDNLPNPKDKSPVYVAAHGEEMIKMSGKLADGINTYLMPTEHTSYAREMIGESKTLTVVLPCCLCSNSDQARSTARRSLSIYFPLEAYRKAWIKWGFRNDMRNGGSDRLIDSLVAWGDETSIARRMKEYIDSGADQIILLPYNADSNEQFPIELLGAFGSRLEK
ncbi:MAG: LLM class F420-dependent oxidoreductase [Acidimicrobiaceae bacterium]|nr:LLM class F420-dependent oxidoreductase [Acidimicrobiaceae bacterium]